MDAVVREFEREYAHGHRLDAVRNFVNKYYIQGGRKLDPSTQHNKPRGPTATATATEKDIEAKLDMLEKLLGTRKGSSTTSD